VDYGRQLRFGAFLTPVSADPERVVGLALHAEAVGFDLVTFQDHPYQPALLDAWTLLAYVAGRTSRIRLAPNVLNLPLRPPAVVARAAAALDLLSGGRFDLALGAGGFGDAVAAMGGPRRSPGDAVRALREAIGLIRELWDTETRGGVRSAGDFYAVAGAKRGPRSAHPIEIWLGAYKPRMLRLVGSHADGWVPSMGYLPPSGLAAATRIVDDAAEQSGRRPADIRRLYNLDGDVDDPGLLTELALEHGIDTFILGSDDADTLSRFAAEVAPATRAAVEAERSRPRPEP
jgi:alkanesulfonate monooxygenase SsuD/methylene tetrahydromethanopterin reductase-like flavin-dependent oxidoreductase (luciferase family)